MKICAISDLHGYLPKDIPDAEVLCICGDIAPLDYQNDDCQSIAWFCLEFIPWIDNLSVEKVILIGGNHDFFLYNIQKRQIGEHEYTLKSGSDCLKRLLPGINKGKYKLIYLFDNSYEYKGITFYGTPWIPELSRWAFYGDHSTLIDRFSKIPKKVDILMSHSPSSIGTTGEVLQKGQFNSGARYGSTELACAISERDIKWNLVGHVHSGNHILEEINGTKFVNVSLKDEDYRVTYEPFIFEI